MGNFMPNNLGLITVCGNLLVGLILVVKVCISDFKGYNPGNSIKNIFILVVLWPITLTCFIVLWYVGAFKQIMYPTEKETK